MLVDGLWNLLHCLAKPFLCGVAGFPNVDLLEIATIWFNSRLYAIQVRIRPHLARVGPAHTCVSSGHGVGRGGLIGCAKQAWRRRMR